MTRRLLERSAFISALWVIAVPAVGKAEGADVSSQDRARDSYEKALRLYDQKEYRAALAELELAERLAPSFKLYYNIALVNLALDDSAAALRAFESYLELGRSTIDSERVAQVEQQVKSLRSKVATLQVEVGNSEAVVLVDGAEVGPSPLRNFYLNVGHHDVQVRAADGRRSAPQSLELRAGAAVNLRLELEAATASPPALPEPAKPTPKPHAADLPWAAYGVTAVLTGAFAATGVLALNARADERDAQHRLTNEAELQDARQKVSHLALTTDILLGAALVSAGVATYLTLKRHDGQQMRLGLAISTARASAFVRF
ncbi:MAG TPA: hypothetical protein VHB79_04645 [Polyangiaceae bacterium]|nr:hypothetical protein [Polyangiaceae bacterium]